MLYTGIPYSDVNLHTHSAEQPRWTAFSSLSEVTSLAVEFTFLARASGAAPQGLRSPAFCCLLLPCACAHLTCHFSCVGTTAMLARQGMFLLAQGSRSPCRRRWLPCMRSWG